MLISKLIRKAIAIGLTGSLLIGMVTTSYAKDLENSSSIQDQKLFMLVDKKEEITFVQKEKIKAEAELVKEVFQISTNDILAINLKEERNLYTVQMGEYENTIEVLEKTSNETRFKITQGDIQNIWVEKSDGTIILDGNVLELETENEIVPLNSDTYYTKKPIYGKAADYSKYVSSSSKKNIPLSKSISNLTMTVFQAILGEIIGPVANTIASSIYSFVKSNDSSTKGLSYKAKIYVHKNANSSGYIKSVNAYVRKYNYTWYSKINYKGKTTKQTAYQVRRMY